MLVPLSCSFKRKKAASESDPTSLKARRFKRSKSENVSLLKRYLICCAHLIYVKADTRERDENEKLIPPTVPLKKAYAPSSDLPQRDIVAVYFDDIDRTVVSQSKSKTHVFAPPSWTLMEAYLFPWIRYNANKPIVALNRCNIKHMAFRIWEYLASHGKTVIKYDDWATQPPNVPLGDIRGWWWESDGDKPRKYDAWLQQRDYREPDDYCQVLLTVMAKPWPSRIDNFGLGVDDVTPAPEVEPKREAYLTASDLPVPMTRHPTSKRSSRFPGPRYGRTTGISKAWPTTTRPTSLESRTKHRYRIPGCPATPNLDNESATASEKFIVPPQELSLPADVADYFGVATVASSIVSPHFYGTLPSDDLIQRPPSISTELPFTFDDGARFGFEIPIPTTNSGLYSLPVPVSADNVLGSNHNLKTHYFDDFCWTRDVPLRKPGFPVVLVSDQVQHPRQHVEIRNSNQITEFHGNANMRTMGINDSLPLIAAAGSVPTFLASNATPPVTLREPSYHGVVVPPMDLASLVDPKHVNSIASSYDGGVPYYTYLSPQVHDSHPQELFPAPEMTPPSDSNEDFSNLDDFLAPGPGSHLYEGVNN